MKVDENQWIQGANYGLPLDIERLIAAGYYEQAQACLDREIKWGNWPDQLKDSMKFEKERLQRHPLDYPYSKEEALAVVRKAIQDFSVEEFDAFVQDRSIDWIFLEGQVRYFGRFFESLLKTNKVMAERAKVQQRSLEASQSDKEDSPRSKAIARMKEQGFMKSEIRLKLSLRVKDECFEPGPVLVHLPIPCRCPGQQEIDLEESNPSTKLVDDETSRARTIAWQETLNQNKTFSVTFRVLHEAHYNDLTKPDFQPKDLKDMPEPSECLGEQPPHLVKSPMIVSLAKDLTKDFDRDFDKARAIYDYITKTMNYSFMPAYFSLRDIPEYAIKNNRGDCGVFALTMISLCRAVGIPAFWQSGLAVEPSFVGAHDWLWFYTKDFGWLPCDPSYGVSCHRDHLEDQRQFYFGNLDGYRVVFNQSFQEDLIPHKSYFRADPYDNQVGEIETTRGLNYQEFERSRELLSFKALAQEADHENN